MTEWDISEFLFFEVTEGKREGGGTEVSKEINATEGRREKKRVSRIRERIFSISFSTAGASK